MKKLILILTGLLLMSSIASAAPAKKALVLAVFGTSTEASVTFDQIVPMLKTKFKDRDVYVPYTSSIIRNKLNAELTEKILSPDEMFAKLKKDGYTDIAVATTLLFAGVEYDKLKASVDTFTKANKGIKVSFAGPLMADEKNIQPVVNTLKPYIIADGINFVVTHGTHEGHAVEKTYLAVQKAVEKTYVKSFVGSIEGVPDMETTLETVEKIKDKKVRFLVFMFVAGDHAENDIAGDEEDSLFTAVKEMGKTPDVVMVKTSKGERILSLGLDPAYQKLLIDHIAKTVK